MTAIRETNKTRADAQMRELTAGEVDIVAGGITDGCIVLGSLEKWLAPTTPPMRDLFAKYRIGQY